MMLNIFSCASWPSVCCRLWRNVYLFLLPMSWLGCLVFCCWVVWAVCIFWKLSLCRSPYLQIFFSYSWVVFLFMVSFTVQKLLSLIRSHLFIFAFVSNALGNWPKKTSVWFMSENVFAASSSRSVTVSCLKTFWVSSCVWCEGVLKLHWFICGCPAFPTPLAEETVFSYCVFLPHLAQDCLTTAVWVYFWGLHSAPLIHVCFCANATLFWFLWLYSYAWSLGGLCLLLCFF